MSENQSDRQRHFWMITASVSVAVGLLLVGSLPLLLVGAAALVVLLAPGRWKATVLVITSQLPVDLGTVRGIPDVLLIEVLALPMLAFAAIDAMARKRRLVPRSARWISVFVALFAAVAVAHASGILGAAGSIGSNVSAPNLRAYLDLGLGICVFVATLYWADADSEWTDAPLILVTTLGVVTGCLRLAVYYTGFTMPLLGGRFQYDVVTSVSGVQAARIGGLTESASFAIGGAVGLFHRRSLPALVAIAGLSGLVFAAISGGRSYGIGLVMGLLVYFTVLPSRRAWPRLAAMAAASGLTLASIAAAGLGAQLTRLAAFTGGIEAQDPYRYEAMIFMWIEFLRQPFLGKGIGAPGVGVAQDFVADIVAMGGHATYLSALANFGIPGLLANVAVLGGSIVRAWRALRTGAVPTTVPSSGWLAMVLYILVTRVAEYTVAGNGYSDFSMYAIAASALALSFVAGKGAEDA